MKLRNLLLMCALVFGSTGCTPGEQAVDNSPSADSPAQGHDDDPPDEDPPDEDPPDEDPPDEDPTTNNDLDLGLMFEPAPGVETAYDFGSAAPDDAIVRTLTVGAGDYVKETTVTEVAVDGDVFRLVKEDCEGATFPGPACTVTISATPPDDGEYRGALRVSVGSGARGRNLLVRGETPDEGETPGASGTPDDPDGDVTPMPTSDTGPPSSASQR